jgi:Peptidase family M1 domain/Peptidase M1 N-terminal domain/Putative Ig domain/Dockerin type I domain
VKTISVLTTVLILIMFSSTVVADSPDLARAFFEKIGQQDLIIDDISSLTDEELRDMIKTTHDNCRYGKAMRLQNYRDIANLDGSKSALITQTYWDALYYELNFEVEFGTEIITGYVQTHGVSLITDLSFIELDLLDNMLVDSVKMNGAHISFTHSNDLVTATLDDTFGISETFSVYVYYHGHPTEGGFQAFAFGTHNSGTVDVATTLSEPYFARSWWPCKDYPEDKADSVDIIITHPDDFVCASNGLLGSIYDNGDGTKTTTWQHRYPITTYLVAIGVTNYIEFREWYVSEVGDSMPVDFFVYPEKYTQASSSFPITVDMIDTFAVIFNEYPFVTEKYGMLHFDWGGAMEHQTNTSMSSTAYYQSIIAHELAHQWYGDMITCDDWHEIWMNEGFASYAEALWFEATEGELEYKDYMIGMSYTGGGTIWCQDTTSVWGIFTSRVYDKGAWVLHMLRHYIGDSTFFDLLHLYGEDSRFKWGTVTSEQFRDFCIEVSGDSTLSEFFQDWIWGEYFPKYKYSYAYEEYDSNQFVIYLHIRQTQTSTPQVFDMPIDISFNDGSVLRDLVVYNNQREQDYILYLDDVPYYPYVMYFDRNGWILKNANSESYGLHAIYDPLDTAKQFTEFTDSVIVKGGTGPYNITLLSGALPDGLTLNPLTGQITGVPTEFGSFVFTVYAQDASTGTDSQEYILYVEESPLLVGDANNDGLVNVSDAVWIINYVFVGGDPPQPIMEIGDANCDGDVDVSDSVWIINYVFLGGAYPGDC